MGSIRHSFNTNFVPQVDYQLLYSSYSKYEEDWESYPHTHYFTELFYVLGGTGNFCVEEECFPLSPNDFVLVNSNIEHTEISKKKDPLEYIVLGIDGLNFLIDGNKEYMHLHFRSTEKEIIFYFKSILKEMERKEKNYEKVCHNLLDTLIIQLTRRTNSAVDLLSAQKKVSRECSRAKRYIDSNYSEEITLDKLADVARLNKYYFAHTFTEIYGISPINYLIQKRIFISQELLTSTDMSLSEISQQCGFSSPSYFSQSFHKACGITPATYRKQFL